MAAFLAGCWGGSSDDNGSGVELSGTIAGPDESAAGAGGAVGTAAMLSTSAVGMGANGETECENVPRGYVPLRSATLIALDGNDEALGEFAQTDACGLFSGRAPRGTQTVRAEAAGYRPLETSVQRFTAESRSPLASTISADSGYVIGVLQRQSDGRMAFTVVDDKTSRSVIGIPARAFSVEVNGAQVGVTEISDAAVTGEAASVVLVLDASGSMSRGAYIDPDGVRFTRWHLTRLATHEFLDSKAPADKVAFLIFDRSVDFIDNEWIENNWTVRSRMDGSEVGYRFSDSGFTTEAEDLRLIADAFSPYSSVYQNPRTSFRLPDAEMHPVTAALDLEIERYAWGGFTALFAAVDEGIDRLLGAGNERKVLVTMGDGGDNSSWPITKEHVIERANQNGITMYAVGLGVGDPDRRRAAGALRDLGEETGGAYFGVESLDLQGAFDSIQTGIVFQYLATLTEEVNPGDTVKLTLSISGLEAEREVTIAGASE